MARFLMVSLIAGLFSAACTTPQASAPASSKTDEPTAESSASHPKTFAGWYKGTVDEALAQAKVENKAVFLYWGAVWCPPCNEIKSTVFTTDIFAALMRDVIPIYLDGDTASAQLWADRLKVAGYPTLLVLAPNGEEIVRIGEFVDAQEFAQVFTGALASRQAVQKRVAKALAGEATAGDWRLLAYQEWEDSADFAGGEAEKLRLLMGLAQRVPAGLAAERALLYGLVLENAAQAASEPTAGTAALVATAHGQAEAYVKAILATPVTRKAARFTIIDASSDVIRWTYGKQSGPARDQAVQAWLAAADELRHTEDLNLATRLAAIEPHLALTRIDNTKAVLPAALIQDVRAAVAQAQAQATNAYIRHAVIPQLASLLKQIGDGAAAERLLTEEIRTTDTPWYYQAVLATMAEEQGKTAEALEYSAAARQSARGDATRVQWIVEDLLLNSRIDRPDRGARVAGILDEYYHAVVGTADGFSGRNFRREKKVLGVLAKLGQDRNIKEVVARHEKRCAKTAHAEVRDCTAHFADLAKQAEHVR